MLTVAEAEFWEGVEPLPIGGLPSMQARRPRGFQGEAALRSSGARAARSAQRAAAGRRAGVRRRDTQNKPNRTPKPPPQTLLPLQTGLGGGCGLPHRRCAPPRRRRRRLVRSLALACASFADAVSPSTFHPPPLLKPYKTSKTTPATGDNVCVTKGVVSRLDRQTYAHGRTALLTIQARACSAPLSLLLLSPQFSRDARINAPRIAQR